MLMPEKGKILRGSHFYCNYPKVNKAKYWFWVWYNAVVTYIVAAYLRSKQVIIEHSFERLPNTILCVVNMPTTAG